MANFLSKDTINECFELLNTQKYSNDNRSFLFQFLLLKHAGFNELNYIDLGSQTIKEKIFEAANKLSAFTPGEDSSKDQYYNFINPLKMTKWEVREPLLKWSRGRLKNNILGGWQQWKQIYNVDNENSDKIVEKINGISKIIDNDERFPVELLAIWLNRFTKFSSTTTASKLIENFYTFFPLKPEEKDLLFSNTILIEPKFSPDVINPNEIRKLIGNPSKDKNWISSHINTDKLYIQTIKKQQPSNINNSIASPTPTKSQVSALLSKAKQVILMGPPGTSKSYIAEQIAKDYIANQIVDAKGNKIKNVLHIQFHPQYTYQEFIGGKILKDNSFEDQNGIFINF